MKNLEKILNPDTREALDPQYVVAVVRHKGIIYWLLIESENLILDWKKRRDEFISAGYQYPDLSTCAAQRAGIVLLDQSSVDKFLYAPETHKLSLDLLRDALLKKLPSAQSWWDVYFLFPVAFIDFDNRHLASFYPYGPRLERYVPDGWVGESVDFTNTYSEEIFPVTTKFWIVDGKDLLRELMEHGRRAMEGPMPSCVKVDNSN